MKTSKRRKGEVDCQVLPPEPRFFWRPEWEMYAASDPHPLPAIAVALCPPHVSRKESTSTRLTNFQSLLCKVSVTVDSPPGNMNTKIIKRLFGRHPGILHFFPAPSAAISPQHLFGKNAIGAALSPWKPVSPPPLPLPVCLSVSLSLYLDLSSSSSR